MLVLRQDRKGQGSTLKLGVPVFLNFCHLAEMPLGSLLLFLTLHFNGSLRSRASVDTPPSGEALWKVRAA